MSADRVLVNFRLDSQLVEDMDAAAARAGLNRTEWVRTVVTVAVRRELDRTGQAVAARVPPDAIASPPGTIDGCAHQRSRRARAADGTLWCMDCRTVLERRRQGA